MSERPVKHGRRLGDNPVVTRIRVRLSRMNRWLLHNPLAAYVFLVLSIAFAIGWFQHLNSDATNRINVDRAAARDDFDTALSSVVVAQIDNCKADHKFRVQYRIRGQFDKKLVTLFVQLAQAQVSGRVMPPPTQDQIDQAEKFLRQFRPFTRRINVIPVPDCGRIAARLRHDLSAIGATVPPRIGSK